MSLPTRKIGNTDVSAIGFGVMGLSAGYGSVEGDEERFKVLDAVFAAGCTFWDTADVYLDNEDLIGKWFKRTGKRDQIFLATKFGATPSGRALVEEDFEAIQDKLMKNEGVAQGHRFVTGDPEYVKIALERSLKRLGVDYVDLFYLHRVDPIVPIERTVGAMAELVKAGKIKYIGLSEMSAATLRRAHAVHPIAAVQMEYSPFTLDIEDEQIKVLATCRELGVKVVAYAPLGRGLLTGQYKSPDDFESSDFRRLVPRYSAENFPNILKLAAGLKAIGDRHGATAGQVALAWLLGQGDDIIPIPGTKKIKYVQENVGALSVKLSPEELKEVRDVAEKADAANGARYPEMLMANLDGDTPAL